VVFVYLATQSRSSAEHLLKQDTGLDTAHKYKINDLRHINTCCQQVNSNCYFRIGFVLELPYCFKYLLFVATLNTSGDFLYNIIINAIFRINIFEYRYNKVSMFIINSIDKRFALTVRIEVHSDFIKYG